MRLGEDGRMITLVTDFPAFGRGLSLRLQPAPSEKNPPLGFPRLRAGTFIEAGLIAGGARYATVFPRLRAGTFIEA